MVRERRDVAVRAATRLTRCGLWGQPASPRAPWCGGRTRSAASSRSPLLGDLPGCFLGRDLDLMMDLETATSELRSGDARLV